MLQPLCSVLLYDVDTNSVGEVESSTRAPMLCKHRMEAVGHKLLVVGGWDGDKRRHHCWIFDTRHGQWTLLNELVNFDPEQAPAGLSSHTFSRISENYFIVTGREGSVRYQKRFASIFQMRLIDKDEQKPKFHYTRLSHQIESRSGHSASVVPKFARGSKEAPAVLIMGGRNSSTMDSIPLKQFKEEKIRFPDHYPEFLNIIDKLSMKPIGNLEFILYIAPIFR